MMESFRSCLAAMFWSLVLLIFLVFVCALNQGTGPGVRESGSPGVGEPGCGVWERKHERKHETLGGGRLLSQRVVVAVREPRRAPLE